MNIGDSVIVKTSLTKCRLLGTIIAIKEGGFYTVKLPFPIRGEEYVTVQRRGNNIIRLEEKKPVPVHNKAMKEASKKIVQRLESIATTHEQRQEQQQQQQPKQQPRTNTDIESGSWLDYMKQNGIE